jgi:hypothetical protein
VDAMSSLEARVHALEKSGNRSRRAAWALGLLLAFLSLTALLPQATPEVRTSRLVLTRPNLGYIVLLAGPDSSLVIASSNGTELVRLGGRAVRPVR